MIVKLLVANRGEIARRIFRTCQAMGIATVAVYAPDDASSPHVVEADEAVLLPGQSAAETYLNIGSILAAATTTGAEGIHPGYGFLSENAAFARAVEEAGLVWVGPPPNAIESMGSKIEAKRIMSAAGVPVLGGAVIEGSTDISSAAREIGYPVLVKASAGGGGKGMRIVDRPDDLTEAVEGARREAEASFGDGTLFLEKYLDSPRHIEIQVLADKSGQTVSLHERECSIQRRHQKIVEEAPSPVIEEAMRATMGQAAVDAARAVDYVGAGTVEFLYQDGDFYFLEMNTRLQVEHPVTEEVTGLDLVRLQLEIATGGRVPSMIPQPQGHAIEVRLYAEDPTNSYLPVTGRFHRFHFPPMPGLRVDAGIESGSTVGTNYDPMIAKVIMHAETRREAASRLATALRRAEVHGSTTNLPLLVRVLEDEEFLAGRTDTHFLQRHDPADLGRPLLTPPEEGLAAIAVAAADQVCQRDSAAVLATIPSGWRNSPSSAQSRSYVGPSGEHEVEYTADDNRYRTAATGGTTVLNATASHVEIDRSGTLDVFNVSRYGDARYVNSEAGGIRLEVVPRFPERQEEADQGSLHAPMPGKIVAIDARVGDTVEEGQRLVVLEAMKMEHTLRAPSAGSVIKINCAAGDQVEAGSVLIVVDDSTH